MRRYLVLIVFVFFTPWVRASNDAFESPIHFQNHQELFGYIARQNELNEDDETLLKLASDSQVEYFSRNSISPLRAVIMANWIKTGKLQGVNQIRGHSGNGMFYVVEFSLSGIDLIGILEGNGWQRSIKNGHEIITTWHMCTVDSIERVYQFNGRVFEQTQSHTVKK